MAGQVPLAFRISANLDEMRKNLAEGVAQLETTKASMRSMSNAFDGSKVISDANAIVKVIGDMGGAATLTDKEQARVNATLNEALEKYRLLGKDAPQAMRDLEAATRSVETPSQNLTQRMVGLATAFGSFLGNLGAELVKDAGRALFEMGKDAFESAGQILDLADQTGLTADTIQRMQFVADQTSSSLEKFTNASYQLGIKLAGGGTSVKDAVRELGLEFTSLQNMKPDQQWNTVVDALERVEDATTRNKLGNEVFGKSWKDVAAGVVQGYKEIADRANVTTDEQLKALANLAHEWDKTWANIKTGVRAALGEIVVAMRGSADDYAIGADGYAGSNKKIEDSAKNSGKETAKTVEVLRDYIKELNDAKEHVAGLTATQLKEIEAAKQIGESEDNIAKRYHLTAEELKLVTEEIGNRHKKDQEYLDWKKKNDAEYAKLLSEMRNEQQKAQMDADAATMARSQQNIDSERQMQIDAWQMELAARNKKAAEEAALEAQRIKAEEEYYKSLGDGLVVIGQSADAHESMGKAAVAATSAAVQGYGAVTAQIEISADAIRAWIELQRYTAGANAILAENPLFTTASQYERIANLPHRAMGGPVSAGQSYMVGERGPEMFTPGSSGSITPNGGGGSQVTVHIDARESFFDNPMSMTRLADKVSTALMSRLRLGMRMPSGA